MTTWQDFDPNIKCPLCAGRNDRPYHGDWGPFQTHLRRTHDGDQRLEQVRTVGQLRAQWMERRRRHGLDDPKARQLYAQMLLAMVRIRCLSETQPDAVKNWFRALGQKIRERRQARDAAAATAAATRRSSSSTITAPRSRSRSSSVGSAHSTAAVARRSRLDSDDEEVMDAAEALMMMTTKRRA